MNTAPRFDVACKLIDQLGTASSILNRSYDELTLAFVVPQLLIGFLRRKFTLRDLILQPNTNHVELVDDDDTPWRGRRNSRHNLAFSHSERRKNAYTLECRSGKLIV